MDRKKNTSKEKPTHFPERLTNDTLRSSFFTQKPKQLVAAEGYLFLRYT